jgi:hypothetical protein
MPRTTFDQLRIPAAIVLLLVVGVILVPRGDGSDDMATEVSPSPSVIVGEVGGEVLASAAADPTPEPSVSPSPTVAPTAAPTPPPTPAPTAAPPPPSGDFTARVFACRSISGSSCNGELGRLPAGSSTFTALVTFTDAVAGDTINVVLTGPAGTIPGGAYTLQGGGDGYYYSTFQSGSLARGAYTLTATRNGAEVASTTFRIGRG